MFNLVPWGRNCVNVIILEGHARKIVAILIAVMVYRASALRGLAITQLVFGSLMIVFGIASIIAVHHWSSYAGFGIWVGIWVRNRNYV